MLEWGLFSSAALLVGWIGTTALAAHQIALQVASILFMVPFGISLAATVRVGHAVGRRDPAATRRAGFAAMALGVAFMAAMTLIVDRVARSSFRCCFSATTPRQRRRPRSSPATLLLVGASFFITDGVQGIAAGALRGLNDTRVPMLFAALSFWADRLHRRLRAGVPGSASARSASGSAFRSAVATFAALLVWRFQRLSRARLSAGARRESVADAGRSARTSRYRRPWSNA